MTAMKQTPAEIAEGLTKAQREFLLALRSDKPRYESGVIGSVQRRQWSRHKFWMPHAPHKGLSIRPLARIGLLDGVASAGMIWVNLTDLGTAVRAHLEQSNGK